MTNEPGGLPAPPWWNSREARSAAREERRRLRREAHDVYRAAKRGVAPHEPVTAERLSDAALRVIDADGLEGLTVRRLTQELGLGTMTLYWYVRNKGEVLDLVADRALAAVEFPPPSGDWRVDLRQVALSLRQALMRHANAVPAVVGRGVFGPNGLRLADRTIAILRSAGFDDRDAPAAYFTLSNLVIGLCASLAAGTSVTGAALGGGEYAAMIRRYFDSLPPEAYPDLRAGMPWLFSAGLEERFNFDLDCLIAGLEARLAARQASKERSTT
jgi:TetR/AcrR family tetracycline transcriptional repressor